MVPGEKSILIKREISYLEKLRDFSKISLFKSFFPIFSKFLGQRAQKPKENIEMSVFSRKPRGFLESRDIS